MILTTMGYNMLLSSMGLLGLPVLTKKISESVLTGDISFGDELLNGNSSNNDNEEEKETTVSPIVNTLGATGATIGNVATSYFKYKYLIYALLISAVVSLIKE